MRVALYLGCTVPVRAMNYERAARLTASRLGIELVDVEGFGCCGYPSKALSSEAALLMAANTLALAEEQGLDICALCSACTSTLVEANWRLQDEALREEVNTRLHALTGRSYGGSLTVRHYARILYEAVGPDQIRMAVAQARDLGTGRDLSWFGVALHYGCHYLKPSHLYGGLDNPEDPHTLGELVEATGARLVHYEEEADCCGGGILAIDEKTALQIAKNKLDHIRASGAQALALICPFCDIMYEINQRSIERQFGTVYGLPVLYYPQLLGLALGFGPDEMGLRLNRVQAKALIERASNPLAKGGA